MGSNPNFKEKAIIFFERKWVKAFTNFLNLEIVREHKFVNEAKGINVLAGITLGILVIIIYIMIDIYRVNFGETLSTDNAVWGTFGDFFGGTLNPILAFVSFLAVIYTVGVQNKQFKTNEKTQAIQQFEGFFAYMATELSKIYDSLDSEDLEVSNYLEEDSDYSWTFRLKRNLRSNFNLVRFFIYLYQILKHINKLEKDFFNFEDKKRYANIIRASLGNEVLQLLYLNCLIIDNPERDDFTEYKELITKFNFLEHMSFKIDNKYDYGLIYFIQFYDKNVFGKNNYLRDIEESPYLNQIKHNREYSHKANFLQSFLGEKNFILINRDYIPNNYRYIFEYTPEKRQFNFAILLPTEAKNNKNRFRYKDSFQVDFSKLVGLAMYSMHFSITGQNNQKLLLELAFFENHLHFFIHDENGYRIQLTQLK